MDLGLEDKTVMITGASGGIGSACARLFADEGAELVLHGFRHMGRLEELADDLHAEPLIVQADLGEGLEVENIFEKAERQTAGVDVLVANAGQWPPEDTPVADMSLERWEKVIRVDQTGVFLCAREFLKSLRARDADYASLILIGSTAAVFGEENHAGYAAAKAAVTYGLTRTLKNEIVRIVPGGRVNAVCPGWTKTPMAEPGLNDEDAVRHALQTMALKRVGKPEDIARSVAYLSSPVAEHITGQILTVAGGMEGRRLHDPSEINPGEV
ncbi:MAG: SDR family NAD(P)-dependent oxidoreductase [Candidatus Acetothermia bacterium]